MRASQEGVTLGEVALGGQGHLKEPKATCGPPTPSWVACPSLKGDHSACLGLAQHHPVKTHLPCHLPGRNVGTLWVSREGVEW